MTFQSALYPIYSPYVAAGRTLVEYAIVIYKTLTSDVAQDIYKLLWVILQVAFWMSLLAILYAIDMSVLAIHNTIESGRAFRGFYEAEWADTVNWMLEYPDRCLESEVTSETAEPTGVAIAATTITPDDCLTTETLAEPSVTVEDNTPTATPDPMAVDTEAPASAQLAALSEALQSIIDSDGTPTTKLRKLATHYNVTWRNTRGKGKHTKNADLKAALQDLCPEVLTAL